MRAEVSYQVISAAVRLGAEPICVGLPGGALANCVVTLRAGIETTAHLVIEFDFREDVADAEVRDVAAEFARTIVEELALTVRNPFTLGLRERDTLAECRAKLAAERLVAAGQAASNVVYASAAVSSAMATMSARATLTLGLGNHAEIARRLTVANLRDDRMRRHFIVALRTSNPVEKFTYLYNILLELAGDKQKGVDAIITARRPKLGLVTGPKGAETIFTQRRNELAHHRAGVDLAALHKDISRVVGDLMFVVAEELEARRAASST